MFGVFVIWWFVEFVVFCGVLVFLVGYFLNWFDGVVSC